MLTRIDLLGCTHLRRLGVKCDGGYVVCEIALHESDSLLTLGLNDEWSFESDYSRSFPDKKILVYDHSVSLPTFILNLVPAVLRFVSHRIDFQEMVRIFRVPFEYPLAFRKMRHIKRRVTNHKFLDLDTTFSEIMKSIFDSQVFVKIDIEGFEYRIIQEVCSFSERIPGLVIEFHDIDFMKSRFEEAINLLSDSYGIVHIHGNNFDSIATGSQLPNTLEITLVRNSLVHEKIERMSSPKPDLDFPNDKSIGDFYFKVNEEFSTID